MSLCNHVCTVRVYGRVYVCGLWHPVSSLPSKEAREYVHTAFPHMWEGNGERKRREGGRRYQFTFISPTIPLFCSITDEESVPKTLAGMTQLPRSESHTHTHTHRTHTLQVWASCHALDNGLLKVQLVSQTQLTCQTHTQTHTSTQTHTRTSCKSQKLNEEKPRM